MEFLRFSTLNQLKDTIANLVSKHSTLVLLVRSAELGNLIFSEPEKIPCAMKLPEGCLNFVISFEKPENKENEPPVQDFVSLCENCGELRRSSKSQENVSNDFSSKRGSSEASWLMREKSNRQRSELKKKLKEIESAEEESNGEYVERITRDIFSNIEENFEIKQSLSEIEDLMRSNLTKMRLLEQQILSEYDAIELSSMEDELESLREMQNENQLIYEKLHEALKVNQNQKVILSDLLLKFSEESRNTLKETEISLVKHQLANIELSAANNELLQEVHSKSKRISELECLTSPASTYLQSASSLLFKSETRSKPNSEVKRSDDPPKKQIFLKETTSVEKPFANKEIVAKEIFVGPAKETAQRPRILSRSSEKKRLVNIESFCEGEGIQIESPKLEKTSRILYHEASPQTMLAKDRKPKLSASEEECVLLDSSVEEII